MSRTRLAVLAGAVIVAAGLGTGLGVGLSGSSGQGPTATAQLASVRSGCEQSLDSAPARSSGTSQLCRDMTDWMSQYMLRDGAGPQMMWGNPSRLAATCQQWMTGNRPAAITSPKSWCKSMVAWMNGHVSSWGSRANWGDWMMRGPMMDG